MIDNKKNNSIEFWRFLFCVAIFVMHFNEHYQITKHGQIVSTLLPGAGLGVDFFFILSGYLMLQTYEKKRLTPYKFIIHKIRSIYPYYISSFLILYIWTWASSVFSQNIISPIDGVKQFMLGLFDYKWEMMMLHMSEIGQKMYLNFPTWYISTMLICTFIAYAFIDRDKRFFLTVISPIVIFVGGGYLANKNGTNLIWYDYNGLLNIGWIRGMVDICLGTISYEIVKCIKQLRKSRNTILRYLELACVGRVIYTIVTHANGRNDFFDLFVFSALIICAFISETKLDEFLDNPVSNWLGKMSLALYLNQALCISVWIKVIGTELGVFYSVFVCFSLALAFSTAYIIVMDRMLKKKACGQ